MARIVIVLVLASLVVSSVSAQSTAWTIDANHSHIGFTARHLGFAKVRGEFKKFDAKVKADAKSGKITALEATVDANSVSTDNEKRDNHLRGDDFFAASKFGTMKLVLKSISWNGNAFTATVALTIRNTTKDVVFKGELLGVQTVNFGQGAHRRAAYEATAKINRKEFGLSFSGLAEGTAIVSDDVEITLEAELSAPGS